MLNSEGIKIVIQIASNSNEGSSSTISDFDNSRKRKAPQNTTFVNGAKKPCVKIEPDDGLKIIKLTEPENRGGFFVRFQSHIPKPIPKSFPKPIPKPIPKSPLPENEEPTPSPALLKTDTNCVRPLLSSIQYRVTLLSE